MSEQQQQGGEFDFKIKFGSSIKKNLYALDPAISFTNHGSYGTAPKFVLEKKRQLQSEMENCPDKWFRFTSFDLWTRNIRALAGYLKVNEENVLLVNNATEGINTIFKSIDFDGSRDAIITTNVAYNAILNTIDYTSKYRLGEGNQVNVFKVEIKFPIESAQTIVDSFDRMCSIIVNEKKLRLRAALVDHISSSTAIFYPVKEINQVIRKWAPNDCKIIVDGAHAIGQVKLDLEDFNCDFYVSNLHKWFLAPRGCALLYTKDVTDFNPDKFQPIFISNGYNLNNVSYNFYQRGNFDHSSLLVVEECINFYENYLGGYDTILAYTRNILKAAVEMLVKEWGTHSLQMANELEAPFMRIIKLPDLPIYKIGENLKLADIENITFSLINQLIEKYNVVTSLYSIQNQLYCRISCFVYNCLEDYIKLKDAVLDLGRTSTSNQ